MFQVRLKPGHPTGIYHRAGLEFNKRDTVELTNPDPKVVKRLKEDPWLEVSEREGGSSGVPTLEEYVAAGYNPNGYERCFFGLKPGDPFDEDVVTENLIKAARYGDVTVFDLDLEARKRNIEVPNGLRKADLVALLVEHDKKQNGT